MMLCTNCKKREAAVFLKQLINNQLSEQSLCPECATQKILTPEGLEQFLFQALAQLKQGPGTAALRSASQVKCPHCGLRWSDFIETGRLGCAGCYDSFKTPIAELLKRIHNSTRHRGQRPITPHEIERLRAELAKAVKTEDFEHAAFLRDRLQDLTKKEHV